MIALLTKFQLGNSNNCKFYSITSLNQNHFVQKDPLKNIENKVVSMRWNLVSFNEIHNHAFGKIFSNLFSLETCQDCI